MIGLHGLSLFVSSLFFVTGCVPSDSLDSRFDDYRARLGRVFDMELPAPELSQIPGYPNASSLRLSAREVHVDLLDFLSFSDCELNRLAGVSGSSLGRVMPASQRWLHETRLLEALNTCHEARAQAGDQETADYLAEIREIKQRNYPVVTWNATWAGPEYQSLLSTRNGPADLAFQLADQAELTTALALQLDWLKQGRDLTSQALVSVEQVNERLLRQAPVGAVWVAMEQATRELLAINNALHERLARRPFCPSGRPTEASRILRNVLTNVFVPTIQVPMAEWQRAVQRWTPLLVQNLELQLAALGNQAEPLMTAEWLAFQQRYLDKEDSQVMKALREALQAHARLLSDTLSSCGAAIGTGGSD